ncbi:MAG: FecR family protein [Sediminibacterium magnilacihabitans]|jgi:transmembrane sensor|nr:FecR family protein [Sediminibacterium magnilacihabitans]PQV61089.1 FecR family protein [Sediminibacterium magnilacihabitans]
MNKAERFQYLLQRYVAGDITSAEHEELFEYLSAHEFDEQLGENILQDLANQQEYEQTDLPPHISQEIIHNIFAAEKNTQTILPVTKKVIPLWKWIAAASAILMVVSSYWFYIYKYSMHDRNFASIIPGTDLIQKNNTDTQQVILLNDGSKVFLRPKSTLHYPVSFNTTTREVYLEGEAFFEVAKNPKKPFLVFYNNIVTRVLGTSFTVNTNTETGNVEVSVRTGRVQVYENDRLLQSASSTKGVIVTPNQRAVYKHTNRAFEVTLVEAPQPIAANEQEPLNSNNFQPSAFIYEQEKLKNIFSQLEKAYGIEIVVENTNLYNCVFTGDISVSDLFTKLKIICLTTNSSFEINGTKILIKGKGCN